MTYVAPVCAALLVVYVALSYHLYRRAFVPDKPVFLDDFTFTPFEFQADYEEVELVTADGITFGAWHFRQPGSPQTVIVSGGHKGQRQNSLGISAALWRKGFNVVLYSYRGMPSSDRAPITFGIKEVLELQAVIAFARTRIANARKPTWPDLSPPPADSCRSTAYSRCIKPPRRICPSSKAARPARLSSSPKSKATPAGQCTGTPAKLPYQTKVQALFNTGLLT